MTEGIEVSLESDNEEIPERSFRPKELCSDQEQAEESINELNCNLNQLTEEQYKTIVKELQTGKKYKHFKLKEQKNGKIILQKVKPTTKLQTITERSKKPNSKNEDKIFLTDQQLLYEHVIELTKEMERLRYKNKKRKHENRELYDMYYVEESDDENEVETKTETKDENITKPSPKRTQLTHWRNRIKCFK
jgi:hypothetical protein